MSHASRRPRRTRNAPHSRSTHLETEIYFACMTAAEKPTATNTCHANYIKAIVLTSTISTQVGISGVRNAANTLA